MSNAHVFATDLAFPEGPIALPDGSVVLVEIRAQQLTRIWPGGVKDTVAKLPGEPNGAALGPDGKIYVCNNGGFSWVKSRGVIMPGAPEPHEYIGGSIQRVDLQTGEVETLFDRCGKHPLKGPNDLVFDKHGGLWFTDLGKRSAREMDVGAVYYMKPGATELVEAVFGVLPANGIGLSPDEKTIYVAETPTARYHGAWSIDPLGGETYLAGIHHRRLIDFWSYSCDVHVVENDGRIVAAEFQCETLQRVGGAAEDLLARRGGSREADVRDYRDGSSAARSGRRSSETPPPVGFSRQLRRAATLSRASLEPALRSPYCR